MWDTAGVTRIGRNNWGSWAYTDSCKMLFWFRIRGILCRLLYFTLQFFCRIKIIQLYGEFMLRGRPHWGAFGERI
ncbi:hypothetical protein DYE49_10095 [Treponema rectale]|uniref:Uncharacterized protein n=1 Tax=Treponema rectale TaxID=744512 RepID=A0A7M1XNQ1_9SPIR|nr:hypothetical protein DYE49_10095 [Treponema rectale]